MYSFEEDTFKGNPFLELLKDWEPASDDAEHTKRLRFGIKKAKMIINSMAQIEIFFNSNGANPPKDIEIYIDQGNYDIPCYCKKYVYFTIRNITIERPYLKIWSNGAHIGFGLVKAEGLITLKDQIEDFIRRN